MDFSKLPKDFLVTSIQYTKNVHSDQYPSIDPARPELNLAGKVAIITGASRGLGAKAFAPAFVKSGVKGVVLLATQDEKLQAVKEELNKINPEVHILCLPTDITKASAVASAFDRIKTKFGHADILINNAAINGDGDGVRLGDADPETWWSSFEVNGKGTFLMSQAFIQQLPTPDTPATIINLTSGASWKGSPMMAGYGLSKLVAQLQIPHIAALYPNITAIALHPGLLETDMLPESMRHFDLETPELVGGMAVWLSHPHAMFLSGRFVAGSWDVEELLARKERILSSKDLTLELLGKFGPDHLV
ncbi:NAD(P)-binding protein [Xylariaceae sp. FL0016]|nr:NAD(P)-binding protein [Xylariaceae sp. FL0016]